MRGDVTVRVLDKLAEIIEDVKTGLDPDVIAYWYRIIESEAKAACPKKYRDSIEVLQNPILPIKYEVKASRRAVRYIVEAIERNLPAMPFATRLYFQKLEELIDEEAAKLEREERTV